MDEEKCKTDHLSYLGVLLPGQVQNFYRTSIDWPTHSSLTSFQNVRHGKIFLSTPQEDVLSWRCSVLGTCTLCKLFLFLITNVWLYNSPSVSRHVQDWVNTFYFTNTLLKNMSSRGHCLEYYIIPLETPTYLPTIYPYWTQHSPMKHTHCIMGNG